MPPVADYREILSGRRRDWPATLLRGALGAVEPLVRWGTQWRNLRYDRGWKQVHRMPVPVVSVGNITAGGTGKTPVVAWIASWFQQRQRQVALISRGYGAKRGRPNDEALELAERLPGVPHLQDPDRVAAARRAVEQGAEVLVLDDAYQHRRLHRDLEILLIDALEPFGYEHLLPRGLLREPLSELRRADVVAISRADLVTADRRAEIADRIREHAPLAPLVAIAHRPLALVAADGSTRAPETLAGNRVAAFCGLGNPRGFRETLLRCGAEIVDFHEFSDHFAFTAVEQQRLAEWAERLDVTQVVCTMKDFVKLRLPSLGSRPLRALTIGIEFLNGRDAFESRLRALDEQLTPRN